jgi:Xaa-Pro aminopeptidase
LITDPVSRRYLSGFIGTTGYLLVTADKQYFIGDFRYTEQARKQCPDYEVLECPGDFWSSIDRLIKELDIASIGFEDAHLTYMKYMDMKDKLKGVKLEPLGRAVEGLRMVKDREELGLIWEATRITEQAFAHIKSIITPGMREKEIAYELEFFMRNKGISDRSFDFIIASGARSAMPHGTATDKPVEIGDFVTIDFGGIYEGYCSDMTRTVVVGKFSSRQKEIYDIVLKAQLAALDKIKPGMTGAQADRIARKVIEKAGYGDAFGHGLGHGVGLRIHEAPALNPRSDTVLEPGMVVSVEPGIYIPGFGGVRIEDLVVITEEGVENFNGSSKELTIV